jgi:hypothetical protein
MNFIILIIKDLQTWNEFFIDFYYSLLMLILNRALLIV